MDTISSFFIRPILVSGVLYAYYLLFLRDKKLNRLNRIYLLCIIPVSLILPFLELTWMQWQLPKGIADTVMPPVDDQQTNAIVVFTATAGYVAVAGALLTIIFRKVYGLFRLKQHSHRRIVHGFCLVETDDARAPFAFFNNLFWKRGEDTGAEDNARVLRHEAIHIRQRHSYDRLFVQVCCGLYWINPFFWLIQRELTTVHEFLADEGAFEEGDTGAFAKMILLAYDQRRYLSPDIGFGRSDIKRRIAMVERTPDRRSFWKKAVMVTALTAFLLASLGMISYTRDKPVSEERQKAIEEMEQKLKDERNSQGVIHLQSKLPVVYTWGRQ